ncbi:hypothetical protein C8P63_12421 [Melghirimyces profundicolus]|uniref:Uncharacterized protein n=1 Tax=Melghirimyces profundicolus TaxID=1242148 RepID=A0A2T6BD25_9BACL|nr:hypothetical protein C8P63_12421 [Melghirimyces profundicolus]
MKTYSTHEIIVAECEGSTNSKEKRYHSQDVFTVVNTLQKMAQKRALVGATLDGDVWPTHPGREGYGP